MLIVILAPACDNVQWGGVEVHLQEPPPARVGAPPDTALSEEERIRQLPEGPVLFMAERDDEGIRVIPVGEILADSIGYFPSDSDAPTYRARFVREILSPGTELVLFARGVRVGSFTIQSVETDESFCVPRPAARGVAELIPEAMGENRFLALAREYGRAHPWRTYDAVELNLEQRNATLSLPVGITTELGAPRAANILDMRWDMQAFRPGGDGPSLFAVTHLFRDRLLIERPPPTAYSLFILGVPADDGYDAGLVWYRPVAERGKGAPRFFEQMDWHGDGRAGVLLEVLGETHRWTAALQLRQGRWTRIHEDPCGAQAPPIQASG